MAVFGEYELAASSGLFDAAFYLKSNPDLAAVNVDPLVHYLERGCHDRRDPSAQFDTQHYLAQCEAFGETPPNALIHYLTVGVRRGLTPKAPAAPALHGARRPRGVSSKPDRLFEDAGAEPPEAVATPVPAEVEPIAPEPAVTGEEPFQGYIDFFGYSTAAGGWLFCGWVARPHRTDHPEEVEFLAKYDQSEDSGSAMLAFFQRNDLDQRSVGLIAFLPSSNRVLGNLQHVSFQLDGRSYRVQGVSSATRILDQELVDRVRPLLLHHAFANRHRSYLLSITARRGFTGQDTLEQLTEPVLVDVDEAILCPPDGVLVKGWVLCAPGAVRTLRVRSGPLSAELRLKTCIRVDRADVISAVGAQQGFSELRCGFIGYVPGVVSQGDVTYLEVELTNGEVGFKTFKVSRQSGLDAIRRILNGIEVRCGELNGAFDHVLGPAVRALNVARLQSPPVPDLLDFGQLPADPRCTFVIPLYGRVDFFEYQMALFSRQPNARELEILYVLDDPTKRRELEVLAQSVFERFRVPFRLLLLPANLGFAPANNIGLGAAGGDFVCFLNSDVFPISDDWLERLTERLSANPDLGIIGAQLLYQDGSIQHDGCYFRTLPEAGGWKFIDHYDKGRRPSGHPGLRHCEVITGACMLMRRTLALELGGFDEGFVVGDFEDADLCLRAKRKGLGCAVDRSVQLYHLERKSQVAPSNSWRLNLTFYNAWLHQRRWFPQETPT
jgi:GT2 family glycosyltransferase